MNLISQVLHSIGTKEQNIIAIQIGAMDGIQFDDTRGFFDLYQWKSILIEPVPHLFEELKINLKDRKNILFEQCAIADKDGEVDMLTISPDDIINNDLHPGYKGMSALFPLKNGFGSEYQRDIDVKNKFGKTIKVPSLTFKSLLKKYELKTFDILICDAEGYDWVIFKQLDLKKIRPKFIRLEYCNLTDIEKNDLIDHLEKNNYIYEISGQNIDIVSEEYFKKINTFIKSNNKNMTIVTGLWNINHNSRNFDHYIENFKRFLDIPQNLFIYVSKELEHIVWKKRDRSNTYVKIYELNDVKNLYKPFWDRTQSIRNDPEWYNLAGWLSNSPQAKLEWYNPIVQSKMFMLNDATIWNPFGTDYFFWLDAGITNTVPYSHLVENDCLNKLTDYSNPFIFLSYPYEADREIHGFDIKKMNQYAGKSVKYVCRGGLFGGHKQQINQANAVYYSLLDKSLNDGCMGTEESIFTIMSYHEPNIYKRFELDENGLIVKFTQALIENNVKLTEPVNKKSINVKKYTDNDVSNYKTNLYILTFNFPDQLLHTINSMKKIPEWLKKPKLHLIDNSTDNEAKIKNKQIAEEYNFQYIDMGKNTGICGGRQKAAEHFDESDADFMFFFEDDMTINPPEYSSQFCRNGFRKYIPNLYNICHKIMLKDQFDFLKLTFTEVYFDNDKQCSWYNVPQHIRSRDWPDYDRLPIQGLDPNVPLTNFKNIRNMDGVCYIDGEIYYANWPMIVSKEGNKKMFIDTKWVHPYEQTWMSHMYQLTKEGKLKPAILLASPIWHDRIQHYKAEERREN